MPELRAATGEQLASARLALGRPQDVLALLDAHISEHLWREEGWWLLARPVPLCAMIWGLIPERG